MTRGTRFAYALLFGSMLLSATARAQASTSSRVLEAERLYGEAEAAMARGDLAAACARYDESLRQDPQLGTQLHLADCLERQGKLASAWLQYRAAAQLAAERNADHQNEPREQVARRRIGRLEPRLSRLRIRVQRPAPELKVLRDGVELPERQWGNAYPIDGGTHELRATAPGRTSWALTVQLEAEGQQLDVSIPELAPQPIAAAEPPPLAPASPAADTNPSGWRVLGYAIGGAGLVTVGVGAAFGIASTSTVSRRDKLCPNNVCRDTAELMEVHSLTERARSRGAVANTLMISGGVVLAAGIAMVLLTPRESQPPLRVGVGASAHAGSVVVTGVF